jgi:hypothetical protein
METLPRFGVTALFAFQVREMRTCEERGAPMQPAGPESRSVEAVNPVL